MLKNTLVLLFSSALLIPVALKADMQSRQLNLTVGKDMVANGQFIGTDSIHLTVGNVLSGNGCFRGLNIVIRARKFEFKGAIECDEHCHITTAEPFDEAMFKRKGSGIFTIVVDSSADFGDSDKKLPDFKYPQVPEFKQLQERKSTVNKNTVSNVPLISEAKNKSASASMPVSQTQPTKKFSIGGYAFTAEGVWHISIAEAVERGDLQEVRNLMEQNVACKKDQVWLDLNMLMAGLSDHMELAGEFMRLGAHVNGKDNIGQTHLINAVQTRRASFVDYLIKAGADVNKTGQDWIPPLVIAVFLEDVAIVKLLLQSPNIEVDARDNHWRTALMYGAYKGNVEIVELLLQAGACINLKDKEGAVVLDFAIASNNVDVQNLVKQKSYKVVPNLIDHQESPSDWDSLRQFVNRRPQIILPVAIIGFSLARELYRYFYKA